jgi:hypothetical protein
MEEKLEGLLRQHISDLLGGGGAHAKFDQVLGGIPPNLRGKVPAALPHSMWMILDHMRIAQWDILEFSRNPKHVSPEWPTGYWPRTSTPPTPGDWNKSLRSFRANLKAMQDLVMDSKTNLIKPIPWGDGQTVLREALLVADHNAYHLAQIVDARRLLGCWPEE